MLIEKLPQVQALAPADKRRLIDELWQDLAQQFAYTQEALSDAQIAELLEKRFAEYLANPSSARSLGEVEIEHKFARLGPETQRILLDRLVRRVRARSELEADSWEADLAVMAADPEVQTELRHIQSEFRVAEMDGLEKY